MSDDLRGLIVAGGAGTRLWPLSRALMPKQLLKLNGNQHSLLQSTFTRLARSMPAAHIRTVTNTAYAQETLSQLRALAPEYPEHNLLAEPVGRDSAAAVLWGALCIHQESPDAVVAMVWSDQIVRNDAAFDAALQRSYEAVRAGGLAAIGVPPNRPATTLGYIRYEEELAEGVYRVQRFLEKPDLATAERLLAEGRCVWNAGIFVFHVGTLLDEFHRLAPQMVASFVEEGGVLHHEQRNDADAFRDVYARLESMSVDYLLLERTDRLLVIPADLEWSDLGAWDELHRLGSKDDAGNVVTGSVVTLGTRNSLVQAGKRLVALVGVEDLIVVDTDDALLICNMKRAQDIKQLVATLKSRGHAEAERFEQTQRPWGAYTVLYEGTGCKVKVLEVNPGHKLSLQMHRHRAEHWVVVEGRALLTCREDVRELQPDQHLHIPRGARHRIENPGDTLLRMIEVQQGDYLGEDDIVRFEDSYGRVSS